MSGSPHSSALGSIALATVTTPEFIPGTLVMVHSFLAQNPWFEGTLVVIENSLSPEQRALLQASFGRVVFIRPRPTLIRSIAQLTGAYPKLRGQSAQFLSVEALGLSQFDQVLFCDSDLLFRASVQALFEMPQDLLCCGDGAYLRGAARDADSFAECSATGPAQGLLQRTFNSGVMRLRRPLLSDATVSGLSALIDPDAWGADLTGHTDQRILNRYFAGQHHLLGAEYNYVLRHHRLLSERWMLPPEQAKVIHFNGAAKPWDPAASLEALQRAPDLHALYAEWRHAYRQCLRASRLPRR